MIGKARDLCAAVRGRKACRSRFLLLQGPNARNLNFKQSGPNRAFSILKIEQGQMDLEKARFYNPTYCMY